MDIWSKKWLMSFNPDKTEIMIFSYKISVLVKIGKPVTILAASS
jgi:hypothetical protein